MAKIAAPDPDYPQQLLVIAQELLHEKRFEICVVTAAMACEFQVARTFDALFKANGLHKIQSSLESLIPTYNLSNEKLRKLYCDLTGDSIQHRPFWSEYKILIQLRNKTVHGGARLQQSNTLVALTAAERLIRYLVKVEAKAQDAQENVA